MYSLPVTFLLATVSLFNGSDLIGWQFGGRGTWTVENGAIVGRSDHSHPGPGYLMSAREFQDFRLSTEFWVSKGGNSGIYVREPNQIWGHLDDTRPAHGDLRGYEIQVDFNSKKNPTGSVYNLSPAIRVVGEEEAWNRMEIECRGSVIKVWVNGELVNEFTKAKVQKGVVGMQIHGQKPHDHVVKYRNIRITSLD